MKKFLKQSAGLVTRLRDRLFTDIFASAHFRITLLFLIMGGVILAVAGILAYHNIINLIQSLIESIRIDLASNGSINQETGAAITIAIEENIWRMISGIGLWMFLTMLISAYILAEITLRPIKRVLEIQKRFVANVSHELRTPLSIMKTGSEATLLNAHNFRRQNEMREYMGIIGKMRAASELVLTSLYILLHNNFVVQPHSPTLIFI